MNWTLAWKKGPTCIRFSCKLWPFFKARAQLSSTVYWQTFEEISDISKKYFQCLMIIFLMIIKQCYNILNFFLNSRDFSLPSKFFDFTLKFQDFLKNLRFSILGVRDSRSKPLGSTAFEIKSIEKSMDHGWQ